MHVGGWEGVRRYNNTVCGGRGVPGDSVEEVRARRWGGWDEVY